MQKPQFLNIDLDLESTSDLSPVIEDFGDDVILMHRETVNGISRASLELAGKQGSADYLFAEYLRLVDSLSESGRRAWDACSSRVFDLGFESGTELNAIHEKLGPETVQELARVEGSIVVTVYSSRIGSPEK